VGTILGGVWANDSWGRFWGWDPKENGALMIVLYQLVIVHARLGGYIKDFGISVLAVVGGGIVAFSWWHVNQLGVGLHSYGFTDGVVRNLLVYYLFVAVFTAASLALYPLLVKKRTAVGTT
ncbi:MAG: cytochrome c biogenesis protein CcsA, partial [Planctomycetota bacterium]